MNSIICRFRISIPLLSAICTFGSCLVFPLSIEASEREAIAKAEDFLPEKLVLTELYDKRGLWDAKLIGTRTCFGLFECKSYAYYSYHSCSYERPRSGSSRGIQFSSRAYGDLSRKDYTSKDLRPLKCGIKGHDLLYSDWQDYFHGASKNYAPMRGFHKVSHRFLPPLIKSKILWNGTPISHISLYQSLLYSADRLTQATDFDDLDSIEQLQRWDHVMRSLKISISAVRKGDELLKARLSSEDRELESFADRILLPDGSCDQDAYLRFKLALESWERHGGCAVLRRMKERGLDVRFRRSRKKCSEVSTANTNRWYRGHTACEGHEAARLEGSQETSR